MADRDDLEFTYSLIDRIFRLSLGELADFSGAKYDGDFSLSLEQAQRRKYEYVRCGRARTNHRTCGPRPSGPASHRTGTALCAHVVHSSCGRTVDRASKSPHRAPSV